MPATLDDLEVWLSQVAEHTRHARESLERRESREKEENTSPSWIDRLARKLEGVMGSAVGSGVGTARSLAARGMAGTLEQARLDYAMQQLGRQFAAVMLPVTQAMTALAGGIETRMRAMNGSEQNRMLGGVLGAGIGMYLGRALGIGGVPGALLGLGLGPGLVGGGPESSFASRTMAIGGAAWAGFRVGGPWGAAAAAVPAAVGTSGDYTRAREAGKSRLGSAMISLGAGLYELPHTLWGSGAAPLDEARRDWDMRRSPRARERAAAEAARRDVTPFQAEMGEAGSTYFRVQENLIRSTAGAGFEDAGPLKPIVDLMLRIYDVLAAMLLASGGAVPPPREAGA